MPPVRPAGEKVLVKVASLQSRHYASLTYRSGSFFVGLAISGFTLLLYLSTLAPTVLYYERPDLIDAAMFQAQAYVLGITHPTGYPTYLLLSHLFTYLPFGDVAYRVNLVSAVFGAVAVFLVFLVGLRLSGRIPAAVVGALAFGVGETFWSQAVIAEVYTLNAAFISLIFLLLLLWRDTRKDRYLLAVAFFIGLSLTHHATSGILLPASALFVFAVDRRKLFEWRLVLKGAGLFVLGLVPYLYLPVRASMEPPMREADPTSLAKFLDFLSGKGFAILIGTYGPDEIPSRVASFWAYLLEEFHVGLLLLAAIGAAVMLLKDRAGALLLGVPFFGWLAYAIEYEVFDFFLYFIPSYLVLALSMSVGVSALLVGVERLAAVYPPLPRTVALVLFIAPLLYLAASDIEEDYALVDRSRDTQGRRIIDVVAEKTATNATVLHHRSPLWYMVLVEGRRRDLTLVSPWYPSRNPTRTWSDPAGPRPQLPLAPSIGNTGVAEAEEAAKEGPVYALEKSVELCDFEEAGFSVVTVEENLLYELVPPDRAPYTSLEEQQGAITEQEDRKSMTNELTSCS